MTGEDLNDVYNMDAIYIGAGTNQEEIFDEVRSIVAESVSHYIKSKYWMTYVDVRCSKIPYRENRYR